MEEGLIKDKYELVVKELQTIMTVVYIAIVCIGMLFTYQKYSEFDINIFEYADVFEFLIAPFSDYFILLYAVASMLIVFTFLRLDMYWQKKWPESYSLLNFKRDKKPWFKAYRISLYSIVCVLYLWLSSIYYGDYAKEQVIAQNPVTITMIDGEVRDGKLIGMTREVLFLLEKNNVYAIPITSMVKDIKLR